MIRNDFVSNSSSSSYIIYDEKTKSNFIQCFPNYKLIDINEVITRLSDMCNSITEQYKSLESVVGERYASGQMFDDIFYDIDSFITSLNENIIHLHKIKDEHPDSIIYITEPVDRDRAYMLHFRAEIFKGDL
jgi:hypothetical protein